jgi:hypothetical protein
LETPELVNTIGLENWGYRSQQFSSIFVISAVLKQERVWGAEKGVEKSGALKKNRLFFSNANNKKRPK